MGFLGHWTMTLNAKTGCKIWLDGRPMFEVIAGLEDCRISEDDLEPTWRKCAAEVVLRMNREVDERARIRRELPEEIGSKRTEWSLAKPLGEEIVKSEREIGADAAFAAVLAVLDRICPEEG